VRSAAVIYAKDLGLMQSFYRVCFRMERVDEAADYCVLESEPLTLSLVAVPEHIAAGLVISVPPLRRDRVPIKLAFAVTSIDSIRPVVAELGGVVDPSETQWEFRGRIHCDGVDPEGNVIQLLQAVTQANSQTDHQVQQSLRDRG
jgi:predicted enzyme related to lactoylglutathione lyase